MRFEILFKSHSWKSYSVWPLRLDSVKLKSATGHTTRIWTVVIHSNSFRPDFNWICTTSDIDRQSEQGLLLWSKEAWKYAFYNDNWQKLKKCDASSMIDRLILFLFFECFTLLVALNMIRELSCESWQRSSCSVQQQETSSIASRGVH